MCISIILKSGFGTESYTPSARPYCDGRKPRFGEDLIVLSYRNSKLKKEEGKERKFVGTIIYAWLASQASVTQVNLEVCFLRLEPKDQTMTLSPPSKKACPQAC